MIEIDEFDHDGDFASFWERMHPELAELNHLVDLDFEELKSESAATKAVILERKQRAFLLFIAYIESKLFS